MIFACDICHRMLTTVSDYQSLAEFDIEKTVNRCYYITVHIKADENLIAGRQTEVF